jgi:hypothetical protein
MHTTRTITTSLVLATLALAPATALASGGDDHGSDDHGGGGSAKRVTGSCTAHSTAKLKVKADDGRLETEFEVDQNRSGVRWTVTLKRNGTTAVTTHATTRAPSGSFSLERRLAGTTGTVSARAISPSGETCNARLTL